MTRTTLALFALLALACTEQPTGVTRPGLELPAAAVSSAGFGLDVDLEFEFGPPDNGDWADTAAAKPFLDSIKTIYLGPPPVDSAALDQLFRKWFTSVVMINTAAAVNDVQLYRAVSDFWFWQVFAEAIYGADYEAAFPTQLAVYDRMAAPRLQQAIDGNLATCRNGKSINALANVIFWFNEADNLALLSEPAFQYDEPKLKQAIGNGCAQVVLTDVDLPDPLEVGTSYTMGLTFALKLGSPPDTTPAEFYVEVVSNQATVEQPGYTNANGEIDRQVRPIAAGPVQFDAEACLLLHARSQPTPYVCAANVFARQAMTPPTPPPPAPPPPPPPAPTCSGTLTPPNGPGGYVQVYNAATFNAVANYLSIDGRLDVASNDSLVNVTFPCLQRLTGGLYVTNNRQMLQVSFPQLAEVGTFVIVASNPILTTASFPALQQVGSIGLNGVPGGSLAVAQNPALGSLDIGAVSIYRVPGSSGGGMALAQPLALTSLSGLSTAISVDTLFFNLPAAGQPGLTKADFQAYKAAAPNVKAVCELPFGGGGARVCL